MVLSVVVVVLHRYGGRPLGALTQARLEAEREFTQCLRRRDVAGAAELLSSYGPTAQRVRAKALVKYLLTIQRCEDAAVYAQQYGFEISDIRPFKQLPAWLR